MGVRWNIVFCQLFPSSVSRGLAGASRGGWALIRTAMRLRSPEAASLSQTINPLSPQNSWAHCKRCKTIQIVWTESEIQVGHVVNLKLFIVFSRSSLIYPIITKECFIMCSWKLKKQGILWANIQIKFVLFSPKLCALPQFLEGQQEGKSCA